MEISSLTIAYSANRLHSRINNPFSIAGAHCENIVETDSGVTEKLPETGAGVRAHACCCVHACWCVQAWLELILAAVLCNVTWTVLALDHWTYM